MNYYNEWDKDAAQWIRNLIDNGLIPRGDVDTRSITDVSPDDLRGYRQCHFFAGVAGWSLALRLAGWADDREVWTGSCPCQPFSSAGKRRAQKDERDLWPEFHRLIKACHPEIIFGEQVASSEVVGTQFEASFTLAVQAGDYAKANKLAKRLVSSKSFSFTELWLDRVCGDLEAIDYAFWSAVLGAFSTGSPHRRMRDYWMAYATGDARAQQFGESRIGSRREKSPADSAECRSVGSVGDTTSERCGEARAAEFDRRSAEVPSSVGAIDALEHAQSDRRNERGPESIGRSVTCRCGVDCVANNDGKRLPRRTKQDSIEERSGVESSRRIDTCGRGESDSVGNATSKRRNIERNIDDASERNEIAVGTGSVNELGDSEHGGCSGRQSIGERTGSVVPSGADFWSDWEIIHCTDGKSRRVKRGLQCLAPGIPRSMGSGEPKLASVVRSARSNRVVRLKGYGNSIVPQLAAEFIRSYMETEASQ